MRHRLLRTHTNTTPLRHPELVSGSILRPSTEPSFQKPTAPHGFTEAIEHAARWMLNQVQHDDEWVWAGGWTNDRCSPVLRHPVGHHGLYDGGVQFLVIVQADGVVQFGPRLHPVDHVVGAAVTSDGGVKIGLRLVGDPQG